MYERHESAATRRLAGALRRLNRALAAALGRLAGAALGALVAVVAFDVVCRQLLDWPVLWPSEVAILLFVWSVLAGAAVAARRRVHFVVDVFSGRLPAGIEQALDLVVSLLALLFAAVVVVFGADMTADGLSRYTPMNGYPMVLHFVAFPVAGAAILLFELEHLLGALARPAARGAGDSARAPEASR